MSKSATKKSATKKPASKKPAGAKAATKRPASRDVDKAYSRGQTIAKLRRLADALEAGEGFVIRVAGETVRVPRDARLSVEHERAKGAHELEFQLTWRE